MSKGNMLLGHARGKVGDLVFSRSNGQQIVRARAAVVKNPKTEMQTIQRTILNTVAQAYSKMQPIVDHSFEGIPAGQKTMSAFMRTNLDAVRAKIAQAVANNLGYDSIYAFAPIGTNRFAPNDFVISKGSLPSVPAEITASTSAIAKLGGTTYADIINALGLKRGDQLTFIEVKKIGTGDTLDSEFLYARIILDPQNADGTEASLNVPLIAGNAVNLPSPRNTNAFTSLVMANDGDLTFSIGSPSNVTLAAAIIVSRQSTTGEWQRSNTKLVISDSNAAGFLFSLQYALDYAEQNTLASLSDLYLNNAGTGALPNTGSSSSFELTIGSSQSAVEKVTIKRFAYKTIEGIGQVLMGYDSSNNEYPIVVGNADSIYLGKGLTAAAATAQDSETLANAFYTSTAGAGRVWTNNAAITWLNEKGFISTFVVAAGNLIAF